MIEVTPLTDREALRIGRLLVDEYKRIDAELTDEAAGYTLGAKAASLADVVILGRKFGLDVHKAANA